VRQMAEPTAVVLDRCGGTQTRGLGSRERAVTPEGRASTSFRRTRAVQRHRAAGRQGSSSSPRVVSVRLQGPGPSSWTRTSSAVQCRRSRPSCCRDDMSLRPPFIEDDYAYDASVTTFTAPRADVEAMCLDAGVYPMEDRGVIDFEAELLGEHAPQPGDVGCRTTVGGIVSLVRLSEGDPTEAAVLVYDLLGPDGDPAPEDG